ncbi:hypothetical protein BC826DRAFT_665509 [Russula brevipes]|nr:hypothetical protein BC826DRAFT_665509 [Russula brevipes]
MPSFAPSTFRHPSTCLSTPCPLAKRSAAGAVGCDRKATVRSKLPRSPSAGTPLTSVPRSLPRCRAPPQRHSPIPPPTLHPLSFARTNAIHGIIPLDPRNSTLLHPNADIECQARSYHVHDVKKRLDGLCQ